MTHELSLQEFETAQVSALRSLHSQSEVNVGFGNQSSHFQKVATASFCDSTGSNVEGVKQTPNKYHLSKIQDGFKLTTSTPKSSQYLNLKSPRGSNIKEHRVPSCFLKRFASKEDALMGLDSVRIPKLRSNQEYLASLGTVAISGKMMTKKVKDLL